MIRSVCYSMQSFLFDGGQTSGDCQLLRIHQTKSGVQESSTHRYTFGFPPATGIPSSDRALPRSALAERSCRNAVPFSLVACRIKRGRSQCSAPTATHFATFIHWPSPNMDWLSHTPRIDLKMKDNNVCYGCSDLRASARHKAQK